MTKREELKCFYSCHQHKTSKIFKFSGTAVSLLVLDKPSTSLPPHPTLRTLWQEASWLTSPE